MKVNYDLKMEEILKNIKKEDKKRLLIHSCCGPCSSSVLEYLNNFFIIDIYYFNPNITFEKEYKTRLEEQREMIKKMGYDINVYEGKYNPNEDFFQKIKGFENSHEGGARCQLCYDLRIEATAKMALQGNYDFFSTVLSISPMKNATWINEIGEKYEKIYGIKFLNADFKKKNRYLRSIELSKIYNMYRQDYCGCIFSKLEREEKEKNKTKENEVI